MFQQEIDIGSTVTFDCESMEFAFRTFNWSRNNSVLENEDRVSGVDTEVLTISDVALADEGLYKCIIFINRSEVGFAEEELTVVRQSKY